MAQVDHKQRDHALLSASGASRWMNCTPSARLEDKFEASTSSVFAEEGTLAHEFADLNLRYFNKEITKRTLNTELKKLRKHDLYSEEMEVEVKKYTDYCEEAYQVALKNNGSAVMLVEERFDFSHIVPDGFGTGDGALISDGVLEIIDLKYGKGVQVDATENPQLKLYGVGALALYDLVYDIHTVKLTIVQPRLDHFSTWEVSVEDLKAWAENEVKAKAEEAYQGSGEQQAGEWCKFCKVKAMCATLAAKNLELAKDEFKDPQLLPLERLLEIYHQLPMLTDWAAAVNEHLLEQAKRGKPLPGLKLVEGRSKRKWFDEQKVIETLLENDFSEVDFINSKLAGITAIEKLVGKAEFSEILGPFVLKPQGAPTLVPENDKRPAIGLAQAKADFAD